MNLKLIRDGIVGKLMDYVGVPVVMLEQVAKKPKYPYIGYKFTVPYNPDRTQGIIETDLVPSLDPKYEHDVEETVIFQPQMTISITVYAKDSLEAQELAKKAHDWFKHAGYYELDALNVVTVSTAAFGDRTTLIVDDYERRVGFDVILRTVDKIKRRVETIEEFKFEGVRK